jgi:hypothetical protein
MNECKKRRLTWPVQSIKSCYTAQTHKSDRTRHQTSEDTNNRPVQHGVDRGKWRQQHPVTSITQDKIQDQNTNKRNATEDNVGKANTNKLRLLLRMPQRKSEAGQNTGPVHEMHIHAGESWEAKTLQVNNIETGYM